MMCLPHACLPYRCAAGFRCFGFRAMQVVGVSAVYFRFTHLLGRPRYMGMCIYICVLNEDKLRVTVCVTVLYCKCCMWDDEGKGEGETLCRHITYSC